MFQGLLLFGFPEAHHPHHPHYAQRGTGSSCGAGQRDGDEHSRRPGRLNVRGCVQLSAAFASSSASSPVSTAGTRTLVDSCLSPPLTVYTAYTSGEVPRTYRSGSSSDTETSPAVTPSASSSRTPGSVTVTLPSAPPPPTTSTSPVRPWEAGRCSRCSGRKRSPAGCGRRCTYQASSRSAWSRR